MAGPLVIGYGNPLRGDDGVGPAVAAALSTPGTVNAVDGMTVLDPVQLTPELALDIGQATAVVFVDAHAAHEAGAVHCTALTPAPATGGAFSHVTTPAGLLTLARDLCGSAPAAWVVSVGAATFAPGTGLSPAVAAVVPHVVERVRDLLAASGRVGDEARSGSPPCASGQPSLV